MCFGPGHPLFSVSGMKVDCIPEIKGQKDMLERWQPSRRNENWIHDLSHRPHKINSRWNKGLTINNKNLTRKLKKPYAH